MSEKPALQGDSRVDCETPAGYELCGKNGEHVTAGKTVPARKKRQN